MFECDGTTNEHGFCVNSENCLKCERVEAVRDFVNFVATQAAYNGADDKGQLFYDEGLNPWLSEQAWRYLRDAEVTE